MSIIAHKGRAHADDFLAACVCLYKLDLPVFRQDYNPKMLEDPNFWVLDQGGRFDPDLHNFDHHHLAEEICSFTMVLDYFYGKSYREYMPNLRYVEIYDSYGPARASEFVGIKQENLNLMTCPIRQSILASFSKIDGLVVEPFLSIMKQVGREICAKIEETDLLLEKMNDAVCFDYKDITILDTTKCILPDGLTHDKLPTKIWSKRNNLNPTVVLTKDVRGGGYRMVSINTNNIKFLQNDLSYFTHVSGFITGFENLDDYKSILDNHTERPK